MKKTSDQKKQGAPAPRLRTRLIAILVTMLGIACLIIGVSSYITIKSSLTAQIDGRLDEASHRSMMTGKDAANNGNAMGGVAPSDAASPTASPSADPGATNATQNGIGPICGAPSGKGPLDAPGQSSGTLILCSDSSDNVFSGYLDTEGSTQKLSDADIQTLRKVPNETEAQEVSLEAGSYLVESHQNAAGQVILTGVPLADTHRTLGVLVAVMTGGSLVVMGIAGFLGSWIIRRTMKPLERVSGVAANVAELDLETGDLTGTERVEARDANPGTEVGAVGYALNQLLDNVNSALTARQKTEDQMRVFIADASHELRTPLAAIKGYSDLLRWTENLTENGEQSVSRIDSQTERMSRLVEDLLLLARLDEGRKTVMESVDLTELLLENVSDLQVAAPDHVWELNLPDEPIEVIGDRSQIQQVILNLLSNARKHTDVGTRVIAGLQLSANNKEAVITIEDNGQGIDPEFIDKIFDRFSRADKARSGSDGTTGLGLPIVKAIVEAHGGSIDVTSRPGRTEFAVRLPLDNGGQNIEL